MQELQTFDNASFGNIRVVMIDNAPWFIGKDITSILGYQNGSRDIKKHVDEEDRQLITPLNYQNGSLAIPNRGLVVINESGLYSLMLSSTLPTAKQFKHWVTADVLPQIRQTGKYAPAPASLDEQLLQHMQTSYQLMEALKNRIEEQDKQIVKMTPGYEYASQIIGSQSAYNIGQIAADYGMTAAEMNKLLQSLGVQHKSGKQWILNKKYNHFGYVESRTEMYGPNKTHSSMRTVWTERGRAWIYKSLKARNILPVNPMTFAGTDVQDKELF